jgi:hypothetical protein
MVDGMLYQVDMVGNHHYCLLILPQPWDMVVLKDTSFEEDHNVLLVDTLGAEAVVEEDMIYLLQLIDMVV